MALSLRQLDDPGLNVYYNDNEAFCAEWLRNLMAAGHLPEGDVDERDIREVDADDLKGYDQCHFFAGIGGWPHALNLAGWEGPVWTGSCPCQPLSSAGQRKGHDDERHLWPAFYDLIAECAPPVVFGEQVASKDGREWLAGVRADLEQLGYAVGAADLPSAGVGAPHIRQRLWWVADAGSAASQRYAGGLSGAQAKVGGKGQQHGNRVKRSEHGGEDGGVADAEHDGGRADLKGRQAQGRASDLRTGGGLGDAQGNGRRQERENARGRGAGSGAQGGQQRPGGDSGAGFWTPYDLIPCADGKARRVEPGVAPLAHGVRNRVGRLRAYGNAINPILAAEFVRAVMT